MKNFFFDKFIDNFPFKYTKSSLTYSSMKMIKSRKKFFEFWENFLKKCNFFKINFFNLQNSIVLT